MRLNLSELRSALAAVPRRFPAAIAFAMVLAAFLLLLVWDVVDEAVMSGTQQAVVCYYLSLASLLSLVLSLWSEAKELAPQPDGTAERRAHVRRWVGTAAHAVLMADAVCLYLRPSDDYDTALYVAHASGITALLLAFVFLPFLRERDDVPAWRFAVRMASAWVMVGAACWLIYGGLAVLLASLHALFGVEVSSRVYATLAVPLGGLLPYVLWLSRIEPPAAMHAPGGVGLSRFALRVVQWLFLPLVGLYLLVLYGYLLKIVATWELPDGWVSWLVTVVMALLLTVVLTVYPHLREEQGRGFWRPVVRLLPLCVLPLLVLMTVGLVRRFGDYGVTANRLYMLTFNLWSYGVCVALAINGAWRIHWIPLSFGGMFLLTSAFPVNYIGIARDAILRDIRAHVSARPPEGTLPLSQADYETWLAAFPHAEAVNLNDRVRYVFSNHSRVLLADLLADGVSPWSVPLVDDPADTRLADTAPTSLSYASVRIPEGCTRFTRFQDGMIDIPSNLRRDAHLLAAGDSILAIPCDNVSGDTVYLDLRRIGRIPPGHYPESDIILPTNRDSLLFVVDYFNRRHNPRGDNWVALWGYLFVR